MPSGLRSARTHMICKYCTAKSGRVQVQYWIMWRDLSNVVLTIRCMMKAAGVLQLAVQCNDGDHGPGRLSEGRLVAR